MRLRIKKIRVRNFANYRGVAELELGKLRQPIVVVGHNRAGKTTFFVDAVTYALFKSAYGRQNIKYLASPNHSRNIEPYSQVVLESDNNVEFIFENGRLTIKSRVRVPYGDVEMLTGHNYGSFLNTYVVRQGKVDEFLNLRASERRGMLIKLLGLDFKKAVDRARSDLTRVKNELDDIREEIYSIEGQFKEEGFTEVSKDSLEKKINELRGEKKKLEDEKAKLKVKREQLRKENDLIVEKKASLEGRLNQYNRYVKDKEAYDKALYNLKKLLKMDVSSLDESLIEEIKSLVDELSRISSDTKVIEEKIPEIEKCVNDLRDILTKLSWDWFKKIDKEIENVNIEIGKADTKIEELKDSIDKLSRAEAKCPVCGKPMDESHRKRKLDEYKDMLRDLEERRKDLQEKRRSLEEKKKTFLELEEEKSDIEKRLSRLQGELRSIDPSIGNMDWAKLPNHLRNILKSLREDFLQRVQKLSKKIQGPWASRVDDPDNLSLKAMEELVEDLTKHVNEIERGYKALDKLESKLSTYPEDIIKLDPDTTKKELDRLNKEFNRISRELGELDKKISSIDQSLGKIDDAISRLEGLSSLIQKYNELKKNENEKARETTVLEKVIEVYREGGFPNYLIDQVILPTLMDEVNRYLDEMKSPYTVKFDTSKGTLGISIYASPNVERDVNTLSGGERTALGIAFRLGLGSVISSFTRNYSFDFLIFDEAFGHLDEESKDYVARLLREMVDEGVVSQVIIITHDQRLASNPHLNGSTVYVEDAQLIVEQ